MNLKDISKQSGIYCIKNKVNDKKYIGKSINILRRGKSHLNELRLNKSECSYLQNAWNKYGEDNFEFYIVEFCDKEILSQREMYYIQEYNTKKPFGYNLTDGGDGNIGYKPTETTLLKLRKSHLGKHLSEKSKDILRNLNSGENNPFYNKKHSEESRKLISKKGLGRIVSNETLKKKSKSMMGENNHNFGKKFLNSTSLYFGVSFSDGRYWTVQIPNNGKNLYLGKFKEEQLAAIGFDIGNMFYCGIGCHLNFPELKEKYISYLNQYEILDINEEGSKNGR